MKTLQGSSQLFGLIFARNKFSKEIFNVFQIYESYHFEKSGWRKKKCTPTDLLAMNILGQQ